MIKCNDEEAGFIVSYIKKGRKEEEELTDYLYLLKKPSYRNIQDIITYIFHIYYKNIFIKWIWRNK